MFQILFFEFLDETFIYLNVNSSMYALKICHSLQFYRHNIMLTNIFYNLLEFIFLETIGITGIFKHCKEATTRTQLHDNNFILGPEL